MATTTTINKASVLLSQEAVAFIRPMSVAVSASLLKPNTKMYAYFDGKDVNRYFQQTGKNLGDQMVSDANGVVTATFNIPGMTFNTGARDIVISESSTYPAGGVFTDNQGYAVATFQTTAVNSKYVTTPSLDTIPKVAEQNRIEISMSPTPRSMRSDPIAQSFFTYGMPGGAFITSIDLFFQTKDATAPVWVELRQMSGGVPTNLLISPDAVATVLASNINISADGSTATNFKFNKMVFLEPDKDYCFVVQSRCANYNMWTCKLNENSNETSKTVFEQPYNGTLFKSENNFTWTAEQTQDIKFTLYQASFNTAVTANVNFPLKANTALLDSAQFYCIGGTNKVYLTLPYKHGLDLNSKVDVVCDATGTYNGVAGSVLNGTFSVFEVTTEYIVGIIVPTATFTASAAITTGGRVRNIQLTAGGTGYSSVTPPTVNIGGPGSGAAATPVIDPVTGTITSIIVSTNGTGYTTVPSVNITGAPGSGATAYAVTDSMFTVRTNRVYHGINPSMVMIKPQQTDMLATLTTTLGSFPDGTVTHYSAGSSYNVDLASYNKFNNNMLLASPSNETANLGGGNSALLNLTMSTSNANVSPVIDLGHSRMMFTNNYISNQTGETLTSTNEMGFVTAISIQTGGSGYTENPTVTITGDGSGATATATVVNGVVTALTLTSIGSGYSSAPTVQFFGGNPTVAATAITTISTFNSERSVARGSAKSRYISKQQQLATISTGARVFVDAYSNANSSFEVYIRTSLSSTGMPHNMANWTLLTCDVNRNLSGFAGDVQEYTFYKDGMNEFDIFSIKIVLRSLTPWDPPFITNYRAIVAS